MADGDLAYSHVPAAGGALLGNDQGLLFRKTRTYHQKWARFRGVLEMRPNPTLPPEYDDIPDWMRPEFINDWDTHVEFLRSLAETIEKRGGRAWMDGDTLHAQTETDRKVPDGFSFVRDGGIAATGNVSIGYHDDDDDPRHVTIVINGPQIVKSFPAYIVSDMHAHGGGFWYRESQRMAFDYTIDVTCTTWVEQHPHNPLCPHFPSS